LPNVTTWYQLDRVNVNQLSYMFSLEQPASTNFKLIQPLPGAVFFLGRLLRY
jgi:hypothetical protein